MVFAISLTNFVKISVELILLHLVPEAFENRSMKTALVLIFSLLATACSIEDIQDELGIKYEPTANVEGATWATECLSTGSGTFQERTVTFSKGTYTQTTLAYSDLCETPDVEVKEVGKYQLLGPTREDSIMIKLDRTITQYTVKPMAAAVTSAYFSASLCNISNWSLGVAQDVLGKTCNGNVMPTLGQMTYDLYAISENSGDLRFGNIDAITTGRSPATRPVALATNPRYRKVH
ncbi:hypothetical protein D3C87_1244600 [compost metagenome]